MVYESDFYTTRRPYRASPSLASYTVSPYYYPSRQVRILPGIGRVHVVHSYDRLIPYVGHKRLVVMPTRSTYPVHRVRPSVIVRELGRIQHKVRPYAYYSPTSHYLNSEYSTLFDDESRYIRAQTASLLKRIQFPVPRVQHTYHPISRYEPMKITPVDDYVHRLLTPIKNMKQDIYNISHYYSTELSRKYIGRGHLSCVSYAGDKAYDRRRQHTLREIYAMQNDTVRNDIQLLSYYIKSMRDRKAAQGGLSPIRPSRVFSQPKFLEDDRADIKELKEQRAQRLAKIYDDDVKVTTKVDVEGARIKRATKQKEEENRALVEEKAKKLEAAKKEEAVRQAELARQEKLAAQAAAERAAELEKKAEIARKEEEAKKAEEAKKESEKAEKARKEAEAAEVARKAAELARQEEERKAAELLRQEEARKAELLRLEEIARQAEEEKEQELARQAAELAELARQEAEIADAERKEAELAELAKKEAELAELEKQEKELAELDKKDREEADAAKQEEEMNEVQKEEEEIAACESAVESEAVEPVAENEPVVEEPVTPDVPHEETNVKAEDVEEEFVFAE